MLHVSSALTSQIILVNENGSIVLANNDLDRIIAKSSHTRYIIVMGILIHLAHYHLLVLVLLYGPPFLSLQILMYALAVYPTHLSQSIPPSFSPSMLITIIQTTTLSICFTAMWKEEASIPW